jgi:hypothetical protein
MNRFNDEDLVIGLVTCAMIVIVVVGFIVFQ